MKINYHVTRTERKLCKDGYQRIKKKHYNRDSLTLDIEATFETEPRCDKQIDEKTWDTVHEAVKAEAKIKYPEFHVSGWVIAEY